MLPAIQNLAGNSVPVKHDSVCLGVSFPGTFAVKHSEKNVLPAWGRFMLLTLPFKWATPLPPAGDRESPASAISRGA